MEVSYGGRDSLLPKAYQLREKSVTTLTPKDVVVDYDLTENVDDVINTLFV